MAHVVKQIGKNTVRVTALSIAAGSTVEVKKGATGGNVALPASFPDSSSVQGLDITDLVSVKVLCESGPARPLLLQVNKQATPFLIALANKDPDNATPQLEVEITFRHSLTR